MKVRVLMFGALAEAAARSDTFELGARATAADVVREVGARYARALPVLERSCVAVNLEVVGPEHPVRESDEVALLPPMSGGAVTVRLCAEPSASSALQAVSSSVAGGTAIFVGTVRDSCDLGAVERLEYTAYEPMAERVIREVAAEASSKWTLSGVCVEHAIGTRPAGATTFVVACAAAHRDEAFDACRYVVDEVKVRAPIFKRECGPWGDRWAGL